MKHRLAVATFLVVLLDAGAPAVAQQPITLREAVATALGNNPALQAADQQRTIAAAHVDMARAVWYPRLDFSQSFTRGNNPVYVFGTLLTQRQFTAANFALPGLNAPRPLDNWQTRLDGQWRLFDSFQSRYRVQAAQRMKTAAEFRTEQERQNLILRVVRAYYGVVVARENLAAAEEALRTAQANEKRVRDRVEAGLAVPSDLLSAQVFRAQMEERHIRAENQLQLARMTLAHEMGLPPDAWPEPSESLHELAPLDRDVELWERAALAERPDLRAVELQYQAAASHSRVARADLGPKLHLTASIERDAETLGGPSGTNWMAGVRLDFNLFAGGADRARLAEAEARQRQAERQLEAFRSAVRLELRQAYLEVKAAEKRAAAASGAVEQARESLRIIQNRYEAGLADITELLRAQTAQLEAQTAWLAALHDWHVARAALERAAGRLTAESSIVHPTEAP
ncbi:MAG: TolC family protein [Acidobacteriia bacterium]|jgi:TolC family type I secretion outer membrane protein|nr:TolC family protein [Terriglobia bacterium]